MATETRSQNGCWSCRLRKKKCDEKRPMCTECVCIGLECYGFGEKPQWMDRGVRQKAQAANMKQKVAQAMKNRRMSLMRDQRDVSKPSPKPCGTKSILDSNTGLPNTLSFPASNHETVVSATQVFDDTFSVPQLEIDPFPPYNHSNFDEGFQSTLEGMNLFSNASFGFTDIARPSTEDVQLISEPSKDTCTPMLPITGVEDAVLLAHYIDKTFRWQFRFCPSAAGGFSQGHLIWLMSKSKPLYLAVLALSSSHIKSRRTGDLQQPDPICEKTVERHEKAMEELRCTINSQKPADELAILGCVNSFIYSSLFHADKICWNDYLKTGIELIAPWLAQELAANHPTLLKAPEECSRNFFVTSIMRFHILSAITQERASPQLEDYRKLIESSNPKIMMEVVSGCENWVFVVLIKIYLLRDWKESARLAGMLSLWELTSKANVIKNDLERGISNNARNLEMHKEMHLRTEQTSKYEIFVVTHIFACAVSILLEVIVSGAYPQLPEIKREVERALMFLAYVEDVNLFGALGWPIFVVGCVVEEEKYGHLWQLLSLSQVTTPTDVCGLTDLVESCWKSRKNGHVKDDAFDFHHFQCPNDRKVLVA